jgi:formimidoylglutamate deiminase
VSGRAVGALEAGARADWIVPDPDHPDLAGQTCATWLSSVVFCEHGQTPVRDVFVGGERVIHDGRHRDEAWHCANYRRALAQLLNGE